MLYREFGKTGLTVSVLGFGASHIGSDRCSEPEAQRVLNQVLDAGITLLDTAVGYGLSEERIGRFVAHRRDEFVLSTKGGYGVPGVPDWTRECILRGVDLALQRMRTDRIDIMHLHSCPIETLRQWEVVEALHQVQRAGKVRVVAYSGENEARRFAIECGGFGSVQTSLNVCDQRVIADDVPLLQERGMGLIVKRPIANAFWRFAERPAGDYCEVYWDRARWMELSSGGLDWLDFALRFSAFTPGVSSCIVGTASMQHLQANIDIIRRGPLPAEIYQAARDAFRRHDQGWVGQV